MPLRLAFLALLALGPAASAQEVILPGLTGEALRDALADAYAPASVLSDAASADTLYAVVDRVTVGSQDGVAGVYTDFFVAFDCVPNCDPSQDVFNQPNENTQGINKEHVWPQSLGAGSGNASRDMHHLYPSKVNVNAARGNLPFGESPDAQTNVWYYLAQQQGAPPPEPERDLWSELRTGLLFEPREERKGDVARAMFYFYTMYGPSGTGQASTSFFEGQKETLFAWHEADPPTAEERARSERVARYQATSSGEPAINPFAHDPTLVHRAYFPDALPGPVLFVDADATGAADGTSWADAFPDLQDALALARTNPGAVEEIWVAEGTYYPTDGTDRAASFMLADGVALYGGFAGTEAERDERDWEAHPTVLSGDVGVAGDSTDNAYHVVTASGVDTTAVLDGFVVTGGLADSDAHVSGAGLYAELGSPTLRNLLFVRNHASRTTSTPEGYGGGAYFSGGAPRLEAVTFRRNTAEAGGGGLAQHGGRLTLRDALFEENTGHDGGGLGILAAEADVLRAVFHRNEGAEYGGGAFASDTSFPSGSPVAHPAENPLVVYRDVEFEANHIGGFGSALAHFGDCVVVLGGRFVRNVGGSALDFEFGAAEAPCRPAVVGAYVAGTPERALTHTLSESALLLANSAFVGNGGGIELANAGADLVNVTLTANGWLGTFAGGIQSNGWDVRLDNVIAWGNEGAEVFPTPENPPAVRHAIVEGGYDGTAVLDADPLFVRAPSPGPDGTWGTEDDDYGDLRLQAGSPAVDFGLAAFLPPDAFDLDGDGDTEEPLPLDLAGEPRVQGSAVDLGAYESPFAVASEPEAALPQRDALAPAFPNPFRSLARVELALAEGRPHVAVEAFDLLGRRVAVLLDGPLPAGRHALTLDGAGLPAGVYVVRATGDGLALAQRLTLLR